ncbi:trans-sialidase, putative [Trypanosoma cruzi marinkellei]|uniref:Trans-sialidase, putative n=1 Tax=Trypanosoma cruzi marinkellei TaxID=85056 RepID=K2N7R5_TRYCR|nr:trans-sialidase, putative [Trypanosoma cruzi marinkellei]
MHSRVAAVKGPSTHNRRRVTGSSGRRREGRESGRQRPNMSRRVFTSAVLLFLLLVMCCNTCGAAHAEDRPSVLGSSKRKLFGWRDKKEEETVLSLHVPSLLEMNGEVFAVAEAQFTNIDACCFFGISSELLEWTDKASQGLNTTQVRTQILEECSSKDENCTSQNPDQADFQSGTKAYVNRPTTVVKGNNIYMLAGIYVLEGAAFAWKSGADEWGLLLVRGNISVDGDDKNRICWNFTYALPWTFFEKQHESLKQLIGSGGSGVEMGDGTLVFPVEGTKKASSTEGNEMEKTVSLILYWKDTKSWTLSKGMSDGGCSDPSVVEWGKDGKLMMMTACNDGRRRVYESGDKGESWTEALGTLSRVWGNKQGESVKHVRSGFTTATIEDRDVMLVTLPVYAKKYNGRGRLHLWLTDNTHIVDIGPISGDDDVAASSLLYKSGESGDSKKELIALYEKKRLFEETPSGVVSVRLTEQLQRVKDVLATWQEVDKRVSRLCTNLLARKGVLTENACSADFNVTNGLVGFLSGNFFGTTWVDEYLGVNATVKSGATGETELPDGVTFQGAWAEWPVGAQGENQLYHFANYNFTLVATVSIHKVPEGVTTIPVMGVKMNSAADSVFFGLSYNKEKKWKVVCSDENNKELSSTLEPETKDHVVILLRNGNQTSAYVDGERVGNQPCTLDTTDSKLVSHFYIGGVADSAGSGEGVPVTVTNVLLYNRPLIYEDITAVNTQNFFIPKVADPQTVAGDTSPKVSGPDTQETVSQSSPAGQQPSEHSSGSAGASGGVGRAAASKSHADGEATGDGGTVCGSGLLPSLLLLLLGLWGFAAL